MAVGMVEILLSFAAIFLAFYVYISSSYNYWKRLGIPGPSPTPPFGNLADIFLRGKSMLTKIQEIYDSVDDNEPVVGYFGGTHPILMIKDPELLKHVLIKDFTVFSGRGIKVNEDVDPLSGHLFNMDGPRWRHLRHKLTPVFTTGKLRQMFHLMAECADNFEIYMKEQVSRNNVIECREQAARFSTDVIGSCAFGLNTQALEDEESTFRTYGRKMFEPSSLVNIKRLMREITPKIYGFLRLSTVNKDITNFIINSVKDTVEYRKREKISRNDFIDLLMQIPNDSVDGFEWSENVFAAQAFLFFAAGFETSSTTISFALWELARLPEVQDKLRREIRKFDVDNDGKVTYDSVKDMKYLDMVVKEALRKNPPVIALVRQATEDYQLPGTNIILPAGQRVQIPAYAIQHDPKYYPKPEIFDPERFTDEAKLARHPMLFLPFGEGPKNCIGLRFGYYQVKLALIKILKNFRVLPTSNEHYIVDKDTIVLSAVGGIHLKFEPVDVSEGN